MAIATLSRRSLLRGAGGAAIPLPALEAMLPRRKAWAAAAPRRFVVSFAGMSLGRDNHGKLTDIIPDKVGPGYDLKLPMAALAAVKDDVSVVSGMRIPIGDVVGGRVAEFHMSSLSPLLSGTRAGSYSPTVYGPTSDQIVARNAGFAGKTKFPFLNYRVQPTQYRGGSGPGNISYSGSGRRNDPTVSPALAFDSLFKNFAPTAPGDGDQVAARKRALDDDRSVLDTVLDNHRRLSERLGAPDRARLERHFDEIRAVEQRMKSIPAVMSAAGCAAPKLPGGDPGTSVASGGGYSGEDDRARVLTELIVKAFACDLARVAALQMTYAQCYVNVNPILNIGQNIDLHELAHLSGITGGPARAQQIVMQMYGWHMKHFAAIIGGLKREIGLDGRPLLDNTVLVFLNEGGLGPAEGKNPASHSTENMMAIVAGGRALGLKQGQHIVAKGAHPAQALVTAMTALGLPDEKIGEVTGRIDGLL